MSVNQQRSKPADLAYGVPQGSVLGLLLFLTCILPLGEIIRRFNGVSHHLFADDLQLYCLFKASETQTLSSLLSCLSNLKQRLSDNSLRLNAEKTKIIAPESATNDIKQHLGNLRSSVKSRIRHLGVCFDESISPENPSKQLIKKCFCQLRNISKLPSLISTEDLEMNIHAFVSSWLHYCNSLFA